MTRENYLYLLALAKKTKHCNVFHHLTHNTQIHTYPFPIKHEGRVSGVVGAGGARGPQQRGQLVRGGGERVRRQTVELVKAPPRAAQRNTAQQATHTFRIHCLKYTNFML